jgi:hypothetical protein
MDRESSKDILTHRKSEIVTNMNHQFYFMAVTLQKSVLCVSIASNIKIQTFEKLSYWYTENIG